MKFKLCQVGMKYAHHSQVLRRVSFEICPEDRVGMIGVSGAGKSTIASLIRRDVDPTEGVIKLDGRDLCDYRLTSVLKHYGVILQRPEILSGTVRENITHGLPHGCSVTDQEIWEVINLVSKDIRQRFAHKGLDTQVGKQGLQLSGGEQQRLCVMRALIKNPKFLIVDEATSSLDSETEAAVQRGIDVALSQGISALVIAHRFSTLRNCNRFVVLRKLSECEEGESQVEMVSDSLTELYEVSSTFRKLAVVQGFKP